MKAYRKYPSDYMRVWVQRLGSVSNRTDTYEKHGRGYAKVKSRVRRIDGTRDVRCGDGTVIVTGSRG